MARREAPRLSLCEIAFPKEIASPRLLHLHIRIRMLCPSPYVVLAVVSRTKSLFGKACNFISSKYLLRQRSCACLSASSLRGGGLSHGNAPSARSPLLAVTTLSPLLGARRTVSPASFPAAVADEEQELCDLLTGMACALSARVER